MHYISLTYDTIKMFMDIYIYTVMAQIIAHMYTKIHLHIQ